MRKMYFNQYTEEEIEKQDEMVALVSKGFLFRWVKDDSEYKCENCALHTDCMSELDSGLVYDLCLKLTGNDEGRFECYGKLHPYILNELVEQKDDYTKSNHK